VFTLFLGHLLALVLFGLVGWFVDGAMGVSTALLAVLLCGMAVAAGRWVGTQFCEPGMVHQRMLLGALPRAGIPLSFCLVVYAAGRGPLTDGGLVYYVLSAFGVSLALETCLALSEAAVAPTEADVH
jgi:hypothetical protein